MIRDAARHFEDFDGLTYLNSASQGPLPRSTVEAVRNILPLKAFPNRIPDHILFSLPNTIRSALAPWIGAEPEEIFLGSGAAHGVAVAALGFPWAPGDEVVVAANDFPSNIFNWARAAEKTAGRRILVRGAGKAATTGEMLDAVTPRTRVLAVSAVDFGSGTVIDLAEAGAFCRERGIFLAVDGTQAVGVTPLEVKTLGISLFTAAAYKWLLGPYGSGFAWLDPAWASRIEPSIIAWTAAEGAEDFNALPRENAAWVDTARRFDAPEAASFFNLAALRASLEFLAGYGVEAIHAHIQALLGILEAGLPGSYRRRAPRGRVPGPILCIESDDLERVHADYRRLRDAGIWVSRREDGIRVSPHLFNTETDIDRFLTVLDPA